MARTLEQTRRKAKKRERPLGAAILFGLLATLGVGLAIFLVMLLIPGSAAHNLYRMTLRLSSATLPLDPLFQQWKEDINREDVLFVTPFSLLCGGLTLGCLAPRYASRKRILLSAASMAFGVVAVFLAFSWLDGLYAIRAASAAEGGRVARMIATLDYVVRQSISNLIWIAVCVLGAWFGLRLRDRRSPQGKDAAPALRTAPR